MKEMPGWPFTCTPEAPHSTAYGFDFGGIYGNFSGDVVVQHVNQAISVLNPLLGPTVRRSPISGPSTASIQTPSTGPI